jgi:CubicO group peptidase (beta-lactamase class C family)
MVPEQCTAMSKGMRILLILILFAVLPLLMGCARDPEPLLDHRIQTVENGLLEKQNDPPWKRMRLEDRMAYYNVPGVSIAVIDDGRIAWTKGYGVLENGSVQPVTPETLFQPASLGKPIVAMAALHFVETGLLDLDRDVNEQLASWQVPENSLTQHERVTLRRLLSHSAGVTVAGFVGYRQGVAVPNLQQILDGLPPANSDPILVDITPGTLERYSGGGYMIVQQLLEDVTGQPLAETIRQVVLDSLAMTSSTLEWPLPEGLRLLAAHGHRADGRPIAGGWHTYPEVGAGASMWSTPSDISRFIIQLMDAYRGDGGDLVSQAMATEMLTPQINNRGLGPLVYDDGGDLFYFMHPGANDGYKSVMVGYPERRQGVVIMTNGDNGDLLWHEILNSISAEYGWVSDRTLLYIGLVVACLVVTVVFRRFSATSHRT